ncbi:MAG: hypothetical protein K2Z81_19940 [Cyanobacteria bacterium]|nr:hypothetical protein [Cyanobacteriota bacterium]
MSAFAYASETDRTVITRNKPDGAVVEYDRLTKRIASVKYKDGRTAEFEYFNGVLTSVKLPNDLTVSRDSRKQWRYNTSGRPVGGDVFVDHEGTIEIISSDPAKSFTIYTSGVKECLDCEGQKLFISENAEKMRIGRNEAGQILFTTNPFGVLHSYRYDKQGRLVEIHTTRGGTSRDTKLHRSETLISLDGKQWFNPEVSLEPLHTSFFVNKKGSLVTTNDQGQPILEERIDGSTVKLTGERLVLSAFSAKSC